MWPFLENIDKQATEEFFGFVVAGYSFAQCVVSPIFGYWSNRIKQISIPMYAGLGSMIFGNILYFSTEVFPSNRRFVMLIARFFLGIGSANLPLLRTYASTSCVPSDRALAIAYINGGISIGTTLGPGLQLIFSPIGYPGLRFLTGLGINMYTAPAFTACFVNILCCFLLKCYFTESYAGIIENSQESVLEKPRLPKFDKTAAAVCNITRFTQQFFFTNIELIGSPFAMTIFAFTRQETIQYGSIAQVALGAISLGNFFSYIGFKFSRFMRHRIAIMGALATLFVFHLATYPWAFIPGQLVTYNDSRLNTSEEHVGCNVNRFTWCDSMKPVNPWIYYIAFAICIGLAMPYIDISNNTVYGRILGPRRQGTMQGIMQFCGGLARFIGPMTVGVLYARYGPKAIWITEMGIIAVTGLLWVVFYKRMVELKVDETTTLTNLDVPSYGSEEERERL
ncbi:hypothetical protein L596_026954 [Steinernema carpocapsae]|uniref:Major facilitator superfamily (MFS) profile domain-containing protein n=2 Tax=Steinernema carpocapsae TaxID=34508 RepID=A0A4V5ZYC9_STECR|nr:hypothetical protein L596_026954 [Steinernema carpocapsae]